MFQADGFTFLVEKRLYGHTGKLKIDMTYFGFTVDAENGPQGGGGSCSTGSCSTGGCG